VAEGARSSRRRRRLGGIRIRTTAAAVVVLGAALVVASVTMLRYVDRSITAQVADEAEVRARELAKDTGAIADGAIIPVPVPQEEFVQVLASGRVVASSANIAGQPALVAPRPGDNVRLDSVPFVPGPFVAAAVEASSPQGTRTVVVGRSIDDVIDARHAVALALLIGAPLLLALVATVTWGIVGWTLRPVEDIRSEVERISSRDLHRRVPVPRARDEVGRLAATMNRMLDRLDRSQQRQRRFVADASHELRSPVASIRQHAEVAKAHPEITSPDALADVVLEEDVRLQELVDDLLLLARLDEASGPVPTEEVDLDDLVLAEATRLRAAGGPAVDTRQVCAGRVAGNRAQLERLLRNLGDNAARHARASIGFALCHQDGQVVLTVDDDGPGIPATERERVFERFVRLDEGRSRGAGGTGLGLAIVQEIARAHGGEVELADAPLGGLRAQVRLPA
jgi:signal transduction histidine kinase